MSQHHQTVYAPAGFERVESQRMLSSGATSSGPQQLLPTSHIHNQVRPGIHVHPSSSASLKRARRDSALQGLNDSRSLQNKRPRLEDGPRPTLNGASLGSFPAPRSNPSPSHSATLPTQVRRQSSQNGAHGLNDRPSSIVSHVLARASAARRSGSNTSFNQIPATQPRTINPRLLTQHTFHPGLPDFDEWNNAFLLSSPAFEEPELMAVDEDFYNAPARARFQPTTKNASRPQNSRRQNTSNRPETLPRSFPTQNRSQQDRHESRQEPSPANDLPSSRSTEHATPRRNPTRTNSPTSDSNSEYEDIFSRSSVAADPPQSSSTAPSSPPEPKKEKKKNSSLQARQPSHQQQQKSTPFPSPPSAKTNNTKTPPRRKNPKNPHRQQQQQSLQQQQITRLNAPIPPIDAIYEPGTDPIPTEIAALVQRIKAFKRKDGQEANYVQRTSLRPLPEFDSRYGFLKRSSDLFGLWYGDTRLFTEKWWKFLASTGSGEGLGRSDEPVVG